MRLEAVFTLPDSGKRPVFLTFCKFFETERIMNYQPYEARMAKDTPTGMRYLVRCNRLNKWAICSWVSSTGAAIGNPECQGKYEYVMKKWHKLVGKYVSVT